MLHSVLWTERIRSSQTPMCIRITWAVVNTHISGPVYSSSEAAEMTRGPGTCTGEAPIFSCKWPRNPETPEFLLWGSLHVPQTLAFSYVPFVLHSEFQHLPNIFLHGFLFLYLTPPPNCCTLNTLKASFMSSSSSFSLLHFPP